MIIEHAERFGLSQLHQLRGRVGRGPSRSTCVLMTGDEVIRYLRLVLATRPCLRISLATVFLLLVFPRSNSSW